MDLRPLERFVFEKIAATRLPGPSLALVEGDELVYARGFGQHGLPVTFRLNGGGPELLFERHKLRRTES